MVSHDSNLIGTFKKWNGDSSENYGRSRVPKFVENNKERKNKDRITIFILLLLEDT